jgi:predicted O-methyltransferase YrrM
MIGRRPARSTQARATAAHVDAENDFYGGAIVGAETIGAVALDEAWVEAVTREVAARDPDAYVEYVERFVAAARARAGGGGAWRYADIATTLAAATDLLAPAAYLEIGVRRGRSLCVVAGRAPTCDIIGIDFWNTGYAGIDNPGADHVRSLALASGHSGALELISGNSHRELPRLFRERPDLDFDLITVDGDHSRTGATRDLHDVLPRLRVGGALVFDDISHPGHPYLHDVWHRVVVRDRRYATWEFDDVGFGVAVAVRRW